MIDINNISRLDQLFVPTLNEIISRDGRPKQFSLLSLPTIDDRIWGLRSKKLVVIGARPSQGKTTLLLNIAYDLALQGKNVVFFSLEMTNMVCVERIIANQCHIDNFKLLTGIVAQELDSHSHKINAVSERIKSMNFTFIESHGKTYKELFNIIDKLESGGKKIDAVFIDYIQMIKSDIATRNEKQAIDEYINKLREYAIKKDFLAIIGSQINRGTHDPAKQKQPEIWELKQSGCLEEVADIVFLLHWSYWYTRDEEEKNDYWMRVAKNRDGRTGVFNCYYYPEYYKICEEIYGNPKSSEFETGGKKIKPRSDID